MKKRVYLLIMIAANLLFAQSLVAQSDQHCFSIFGALTNSSIIGESESWKSTIGAQAGVIFTVAVLNELTSLRVEVNGSLQGARWEEDWGEGLTKGRTNLLYANIPLVIRYQFENGFFGEAGLQPGLLLSAKDKYEEISYDYKEYISKFDLSILFGVGYEFKNKIGVGIRVIPGLTNINSGEYESYKDRNFVMALRGTYTLKSK